MRTSKGFSLVEVIIVLTLAGIVGALTVPYLLNRHVFDAPAARDGFIATVRAAQQAALGRTGITMEIDSTGDQWVMTVRESGDVIRELRVSNVSVVLETGSAASAVAACDTAFDDSVENDFALAFDSRGELSSFTNNGVTETASALFNGVRMCVDDQVMYSACVSPAGYAYSGNCDD